LLLLSYNNYTFDGSPMSWVIVGLLVVCVILLIAEIAASRRNTRS